MSNSDTILKVENVAKKYLVHHAGHQPSTNIREAITSTFRTFTDKLFKNNSAEESDEDFWALKDVSFEVNRGELIGIIGRNGAGKSTLLKIISRITEPTRGRVTIRGKVASLLEVGTGFHYELTGAENVYLNGAILGMTRQEIRRKFDEIVAFAEVEKFIDTPIKRYSSGMALRLAFSVAAHLEPDLLIIDEVLAVGDTAFQAKCIKRVEGEANQGRTILVVNHNLSALRSLCKKALYLESGRSVGFGEVNEQINHYLEKLSSNVKKNVADRTDREGNGKARITAITLTDPFGHTDNPLHSGDNCTIAIDYETANALPEKIYMCIDVLTSDGARVFHINNWMRGQDLGNLKKKGRLVCVLPHLNLSAGEYYLNLALKNDFDYADIVYRAMDFKVLEGDFYNNGRPISSPSTPILIDHEWKLNS